ncbi:relaxase/mobilization nuclease domain-containing protein [Actinacidiphila guanduensis]|uniref:Relaxase/Mobilisation nuclease domain-containing protein n=1 Tax=Actinacidiphila guanduensis TaxID=310781 RepID=A0A1H0SHL4_9ACTN|nr:relaxase/mobilization nuclease domain-containing protein [Actinacidiphila guanduensis]SDP41281.1 Relaxase/Mobilisation nuclease domain-containing protein [Actinacidiphila guanduensis]
MIPKIRYGTRSTYGLVRYLFGPGKRDEHTDQHLVASWNDYAPDPGRNPDHTIAQLAAQLDQPVKAIGNRAPEKTFWHCSVRADPGDRHLDDNDWVTIARRIVRAVGIAPEGDTAACRWVAVRHADDHIHIAATLVRQDGRRADLKFDKRKAQAEARQIERDYGLRQLNPGDSTAAKAPTSQERFKAERTGRDETPRETLREAVRQALAGAADEAEFFTRLKDKGLRVKPTLGSSGDVLGYAVALPGDRNAKGEPIWFAGSTLAADLSLPRVRHRLAGGTPDQIVSQRTGGARTTWSAPARGRRAASGVAERAIAPLGSDDDSAAAAQLVGIGEVLDAVAQTSPAATRAELAAAARSFERATRSHIRAEQADTRALRSAARGIIQAGGALGRGEDGGATAMLLSTLVLAAIAAARWHSARGHAQQAEASRQTAEHLRAAYRKAAAVPLQALHTHGRTLPEDKRRSYEITIQAVLPHHLTRTDSETRHDALAATLAQAEQAGYDPKALLQQAVDMRELDSAENVNDVLVWRLRRLADLPAQPGPTSPLPKGSTGRTVPPARRPGVHGAPPPAPRPDTPDARNRLPRR